MYQHGRRTRRPLNIAIFFGTIVLAGVIVLLSWLIIRQDIASSTDPKTTVPILSEVGSDEEVQKIDETLFSLDLPSDWKLQERKTEDYANYYSWISTKKGGDDRRLTLHINTMPREYKLVRLQPITVDDKKLILGNISDECINFSGSTSPQSNAPFLAKWENVSFMCDPISANQTIGTATAIDGIAAQVGRNKFFFYYTDANIRPDNSILRQILQSFKAK